MIEKSESEQKISIEHQDLSTIPKIGQDPLDFGILSELASIGAGHAATALSDVLQQEVLITVPKIHNVPAHLLPKIFNKHEMP